MPEPHKYLTQCTCRTSARRGGTQTDIHTEIRMPHILYIYNTIKQWSIWIEWKNNMKFYVGHNIIILACVAEPELPMFLLLIRLVILPSLPFIARHFALITVITKINMKMKTAQRMREREWDGVDGIDWNCTHALLHCVCLCVCAVLAAWFIRHVNSQGRTRK